MNSNLIGTLWRRRPSLFLECLAPAEACRSRGAAGHFFLKRPESPLARERRRALAGQIPLPFREEASIDPQVPSRLRDADTLLGDEPDRFDLELRRMLPSCNSHGPSSSDRTLRESFPGVHGGGARSRWGERGRRRGAKGMAVTCGTTSAVEGGGSGRPDLREKSSPSTATERVR